MSSIPTYLHNIDKEFATACLTVFEHPNPIFLSLPKLSLSDNGERNSKATRLTDKYPNAYSDFYGSGAPCVFKSGPD